MTQRFSNLSVGYLQDGYSNERFTPLDVAKYVVEEVNTDNNNAWITTVERRDIIKRGKELTQRLSDGIKYSDEPLFGIPFAVKDNIDCEGQPTTAACPNYEYTADKNAPVVSSILDAGGMLIGKTNLDQFATGVVGTRSPYGICKNALNEKYISGGSSSGSAVAVANNQVTFALGTDTGGSGRVPAACNGIIGLKPSRGIISKSGVVPACKSLDCVSIFATSCLDALLVERVAAGFDPNDVYSRREANEVQLTPELNESQVTIGIPKQSQLEFFDDSESKQLFNEESNRIKDLRHNVVEYDIFPLIDASSMLFDGPWVVERRQAVMERVSNYPTDLLDITHQVLSAADQFTAEDVFSAGYKRKQFMQEIATIFDSVDYIIVPTIGTMYTIEEVQDNPIETNSNLGIYTNFVNLLDLCAITIPSGRRENGLPFSITLIGEKYNDGEISSLADEICRSNNVKIGSEINYTELNTPTI